MKPPRGYRKLKVGEMVRPADQYWFTPLQSWAWAALTGVRATNGTTYIRKVKK